MKFTYLGFSQKAAVEMGLDLIDLAILRYFIDFKDTGKMVTEIIDNEKYYWVKYESIIEANPIFNISSKQVVARRMKSLVDAGILKRYVKKEKGTFIFFSVGDNYKKLIELPTDNLIVECNKDTEDLIVECEESQQDTDVDNNDIEKECPTDNYIVDRGSTKKSNPINLKVDTKDYSFKDSSSKDIDVVVRDNINLIIFSWNKAFKTNIKNINNKETKLIIELLSIFTVEEIMKTIQLGSKSSYLNGNSDGKKADISWFFIEDNFIKVMNDYYKDREIIENTKARKNNFHNFKGRTSNYSEVDLERIAKNKREEYYKRYENGKSILTKQMLS